MQMKKILIFSFVLFISMVKIRVSAKTWECPYKYDNGEEYTYKIDNENGSMIITNPKEDVDDWYNPFYKEYNTYYISTSSLEVKSYDDNYCPVLYLLFQEMQTQNCPDGLGPCTTITIIHILHTLKLL